MATKIPYSIKFNLRAFTEGADLDERTATKGRHAHTKTYWVRTHIFIKHGTYLVWVLFLSNM